MRSNSRLLGSATSGSIDVPMFVNTEAAIGLWYHERHHGFHCPIVATAETLESSDKLASKVSGDFHLPDRLLVGYILLTSILASESAIILTKRLVLSYSP